MSGQKLYAVARASWRHSAPVELIRETPTCIYIFDDFYKRERRGQKRDFVAWGVTLDVAERLCAAAKKLKARQAEADNTLEERYAEAKRDFEAEAAAILATKADQP